MIRKFKGKYVSMIALLPLVASSAMAQTTPEFSFDVVVGKIGDMAEAAVAASPLIIAAGMSIFAVRWGVGFVIGLFRKAGNKG